MRTLFKWWLLLLMPPKFYGGGGGTTTTPTTNPEEQALANISQEKWDVYKQKYVPLENEWMAQVAKTNDPSYHNEAGGMAATEVKNQYGSQTKGVGDSMQGGRLGASDYLNQAGDISGSVNKANLGVTKNYLQNEQNVIAMGQGQSTQAVQGMADVANTAVQGQIDANRYKFTANQAGLQSVGAVAGGLTAAAANAKK